MLFAKLRAPKNRWNVPIRNFSAVEEGRLYRGALPDERGYRALKQLGIETVVNLLDDEQRDNGLAARAAGLRWYHLALSEAELPTPDRMTTWLGWTQNEPLLPIYVHCTDGRIRTSAVIAAYRIGVTRWDNAKAYDEAVSFGFTGDGGHEAWANFIKTVKP